MKYFPIIFCFCILAFFQASAQQPHFIYLQTDNNQPFYVLLKNKNYSSSSIGYIILPKLENGDYRIKVGFPKSETAQQDYILQLKDNDQGFLIKNFGEKGSGLFNLQTLAIQYSGEEGRQMDAVANAQREAEIQKARLQQQKDSTEKAEVALAEQKKRDDEDRLVALAAKRKEDAIALEKQKIQDSIKAETEAKVAVVNQKKEADALGKQKTIDNRKTAAAEKLALAKQKKEATALAKQQSLDSIKNENANKIAIIKQKKEAAILAKHEADSIAAAATPIPQAVPTETLAQKKARLVKEKKEVDALIQQQKIDSIKVVNEARQALAKQKKEQAALAKHEADSTAAAAKTAIGNTLVAAETPAQKRLRLAKEKKVADALAKQRIDSIKADNQAKIAAIEQKNKTEADALVKQKADETAKANEQAKIDEQKRLDDLAAQKKADDLRHTTDSLATVENKKVKEEHVAATASKNVNATIVYEPVVLNRVATDSGTIMTYKIPSNKGWDTVTAFIKTLDADKKAVIGKKNTTENTAPPQSEGVKFLDMHFNQDSADKANEMIKPVFNENKDKQISNTTENKKTTTTSTEKVTSISNSNCKAEANDKDFYTLRKKMVAQNNADDMILTAKKSMREKCYSTEQIRNLSVLLITDADRYQFLEAVYPFTTDAYNFGSLADLLKDNYYGDRFKVMLKR